MDYFKISLIIFTLCILLGIFFINKNKIVDKFEITSEATNSESTTSGLTSNEMIYKPIKYEPKTNNLTTDELNTNDLTTDELTTNDLTTNELTTNDSTIYEPTTSGLTSYEIKEKPRIYKPTTNNLTTKELTTDEPTTNELTTNDSIIYEPTTTGLTTNDSTNVPTTRLRTSTGSGIIVFDSLEKIKNNFEYFLSTYLSLLDIKRIKNDVFNNTGKTIQEIINERNIDGETLLILPKKFPDSYKRYTGLVYKLDNQKAFIDNAMHILLMRKLYRTNPICDYYYPSANIEYELNNRDMIIYTGTCLPEDKVKQQIFALKNVEPTDGYNLNYSIINKTSMRKSTRETLYSYLNIYSYSNEELDQVLNKILVDKDSIINQFENEIINFFSE